MPTYDMLRALAVNMDKTPKLPGSYPHNVNNFVQRPYEDYDRLYTYRGKNQMEGVAIWRDAEIPRGKQEGFFLTVSMVNKILKEQTKNRVYGLCDSITNPITGAIIYHVKNKASNNALRAGTATVGPLVYQVTRKQVVPTWPHTVRDPFKNHGDPRQLRLDPKADDELYTAYDILQRFSIIGINNTSLTDFPDKGKLITHETLGVQNVVDYWSSYLWSQVPAEGESVIKSLCVGTRLGFCLAVEREQYEVTGGATEEAFFYQFVPAVDMQGPKPLTDSPDDRDERTFFVTFDNMFLPLVEVLQEKDFTKVGAEKHQMENNGYGSPDPEYTEFIPCERIWGSVMLGLPF